MLAELSSAILMAPIHIKDRTPNFRMAVPGAIVYNSPVSSSISFPFPFFPFDDDDDYAAQERVQFSYNFIPVISIRSAVVKAIWVSPSLVP